MQKSRRQPQSSVAVRRFCKRKSCCHVIAIPQAGIAAPTLRPCLLSRVAFRSVAAQHVNACAREIYILA